MKTKVINISEEKFAKILKIMDDKKAKMEAVKQTKLMQSKAST
jgi:hypothetical protein